MKRLLCMLLILSMAAGLTACGGSTATDSEANLPDSTVPQDNDTNDSNETKQFTVGWSIDTISTPFNAAEDEAVKLAWEAYPEVTLYATEAEADGLKQVSDIEDLVAKGIDLLIVKPRDEATLASTLKQVVDQGIPVICMDRYIADESCYTTFVGSDNVDVGRQLAEAIIEATGGSANVAFIEGTPGGSSYLDRIDGFQEVIADYPDIKVIASQTCTAKRADGKALMENWITAYGDQIDVVCSLTDEITMGVIQALEDAKMDDVKVYSVNGAMEALNEIQTGKIDWIAAYATGLHPGIEIAWHILNNGTEGIPKEIIIPSFGVDSANVGEYYDENLYIVDYVPGGTPAFQEAIKGYPVLQGLEIRQ